VNEFFRPKRADIDFVHERAELVKLRKDTLPAFRLARLLQKRTVENPAAWELTALIAQDSHGRGFAVLVDEVISQQQIVIKPLGEELRGKSGIMGSAILGDGRPSLILDLHELARSAHSTSSSKIKEIREAA
jgi:two-component system chemotaxis sensor kinase CheA